MDLTQACGENYVVCLEFTNMCVDVSLFIYVKDKSTKSLKAFYHSSEDQRLL